MPHREPDFSLQSQFSLKSKNIFLELDGYQFFHSPFSLDETKEDFRFIGREKVLERLTLILEHSKTKSGAYLVTGFRGMGKTSVVRKVIRDVNRRHVKKNGYPQYLPIEISLAQDDLSEIHVFHLITRYLLLEMERILGTVGKGILKKESEKEKFKPVVKRMQELNQRLSSELLHQNHVQNGGTWGGGVNLGPIGVKGSGTSEQTSDSMQQRFPIAGPKEIEWHLIDILQQVEELRSEIKIPDFLFVFDELDKIEPNHKFTLSEKESENPHFDSARGSFDGIRNRQQTIARLLANLKNFLNTARAKFMFIGGREMYDASMADIADRDSFYSSIFHDTIYVESFLKDGLHLQSVGLTKMTEMYLCKLLIPQGYLKHHGVIDEQGGPVLPSSELYSLRTYHEYLTDTFLEEPTHSHIDSFPKKQSAWLPQHRNNKKKLVPRVPMQRYRGEELYRIIFMLQNLVIYLTYRSNGTPKKLTNLFENYLVSGNRLSKGNPHRINIGFEPLQGADAKPNLFLLFHEIDQYVICLHSSIYRPFVITQSRHKKHWGDQLLFSTSYIIDHIFKFHPFGFSWRNLELIPEIISINKAPHLRDFVDELLRHYSQTFIRQTVGGIFDYKFYNKAANEIKYVSKISELSAAAFNFTLDESRMIKRHYHKKIQELFKKHKGYEAYPNRSRYIHSVGFIQGILGDLHFFDKEYDDAIVQYDDAVQHLRAVNIELLTKHQAMLRVYISLKLALTLEKIDSFEAAATIYERLIVEVPPYLRKVQHKVDQAEGTIPGESANTGWRGYSQGFFLIIQAMMAQLALLEKNQKDGITDKDLYKSEKQFLQFLQLRQVQETLPEVSSLSNLNPNPEGDDSGIPIEVSTDHPFTLASNYYHNRGSLLFFKNKNHEYLIHKFRKYDPHFESILKNHERKNRKRMSQGEAEIPFLQAYFSYFSQLGGLEIFDYNPSVSAYVSYRESLRWFLNRFKRELQPVKTFILENEEERARYAGLLIEEKGVFRPINRYLFEILILFSNKVMRVPNSEQLSELGNLLTKIGDCLLTFVSARLNEAPDQEIFVSLFDFSATQPTMGLSQTKETAPIKEFAKAYNLIRLKGGKSKFYSLDLVFFTYRLAAQFYQKAGMNFSFVFQYKKVLHIFKDYLGTAISKQNDSAPQGKEPVQFWSGPGELTPLSFIDFLKQKIAVPAFRAITWESNVSNRPQILKYKDIFRLQRTMETHNQQSLMTNISTGPEIWEIVLLISDIQLKYDRLFPPKVSTLDFGLDYADFSPFVLVSSKFSQILELKFKTDLNEYFFRKWNFHKLLELLVPDGKPAKEVKTPQKFETLVESHAEEAMVPDMTVIAQAFGRSLPGKTRLQVLEHLITDSIHNLAELIQTLNVYDETYLAKNTYLASAHQRLARWSEFYRPILRIQDWGDHEKSIFLSLSQLLGKHYLYFLDVRYHRELATSYYHSTLQLHKEGKAYQEELPLCFYLEDDYNDNLYHFGAALERYKINTGSVRHMINLLKKEMEGSGPDDDRPDGGSKLYQYHTYINRT